MAWFGACIAPEMQPLLFFFFLTKTIAQKWKAFSGLYIEIHAPFSALLFWLLKLAWEIKPRTFSDLDCSLCGENKIKQAKELFHMMQSLFPVTDPIHEPCGF